MKFIHHTWIDERIGNRRGLIIENDGERVCAIHLMLSITGSKRREFLQDFQQRLVIALPVFWLRWAYVRGHGFEFFRGVDAQDVPVVDTGRKVSLYRCLP